MSTAVVQHRSDIHKPRVGALLGSIIMGLTTSSCMSSSAISSAVTAPASKKKKQRDCLPQNSSCTNSSDDKQLLCKVAKRKDRVVATNIPLLKIDTSLCSEERLGCVVIALPDETAQGSSIDSKQFIESNDRDVVVAYSYSQGISRQYTLHDDPTYFIGWEVHIEGEGVGFILSCLGPFFSGVRFEVQLQDGRILVVPFSQGGGDDDDSDEMKITFLQRIF